MDSLIDLKELRNLPLEGESVDSLRGAFDLIKQGRSDAAQMAYTLKLLEEYNQRMADAGTAKWFIPGTPFSIDNCPKHKAFFNAGAKYRQRLFMASNRTGKSVAGAYETAVHATGEYPDWWEGRTFDGAVKIWAAGQTGQTTRDTVQKELFGPVGAFGTGMIPRKSIKKVWARPGVPNGIDTAEIYRAGGGVSTIGLKSYDQDMKAFYGTAMDVIWLDEESPDLIYNECLLRTMTTNGIIYVTFTPLHGLTPFIVNYSKHCDYLEGAQRITAVESPDEK